MPRLRFILGLHCHQPVGNFDHVFEEGYRVSYLPFIEKLERYPGIRVSLHYSGPLLEWLSANHPEFFKRLADLARCGQIEFFGGGHYEPVLSVIPSADRLGQLSYMSNWLKERFGVDVRGAWLTERVWEPHFPSYIARAGLEYVTVDDHHFNSAGLDRESLHDYYMTEDEGATVGIFPISEKLRYLVPFHDVDRIMDFFREKANILPEGSAIVLADDGEKFGMWPGTHEWVYTKGWLDRFFSALQDNSDWLETAHFGEVIDSRKPAGRVYLSACSYPEMGIWSLPPERAEQLNRINGEIAHDSSLSRLEPFIRGGLWRNFLARYPESNWMQKRCSELSRRIHGQIGEKGYRFTRLPDDLRHLWMAQCNCGYWHGIFGGLYLPHIRSANFGNIIKSEAALNKRVKKIEPTVKALDLDMDGHDEVVLENSQLRLFLKPTEGASLVELDHIPGAFNLCDTLARRYEAYHSQMREGTEGENLPANEDHTSIHERSFSERIPAREFIYDPYPRYSMRAHFFAGLPESADQAQHLEWPDMANLADTVYQYAIRSGKTDVRAVFNCESTVGATGAELIPVSLKKIVSLDNKAPEIILSHTLKNISDKPLAGYFAVSFNFTVLGPGDPKTGWRAGDKSGSLEEGFILNGLKDFTLFNHRDGHEAAFSFGKGSFDLIQYPVSTISQSESGIDRTYQASCLIFCLPCSAAPGKSCKFELKLNVNSVKKAS